MYTHSFTHTHAHVYKHTHAHTHTHTHRPGAMTGGGVAMRTTLEGVGMGPGSDRQGAPAGPSGVCVCVVCVRGGERVM